MSIGTQLDEKLAYLEKQDQDNKKLFSQLQKQFDEVLQASTDKPEPKPEPEPINNPTDNNASVTKFIDLFDADKLSVEELISKYTEYAESQKNKFGCQTPKNELTVVNGDQHFWKPGLYENYHIKAGNSSFASRVIADSDDFKNGEKIHIRNCIVEDGKYGRFLISGKNENVCIENCTLIGHGKAGDTAITGSTYIAKNNLIYNSNDAFRVSGTDAVRIIGNYVYDLTGSHTDAIQAYPGGSNVEVADNIFFGGRNTSIINGINIGWQVYNNLMFGSMFSLHIAPEKYYLRPGENPIITENVILGYIGGPHRYGDIGHYVWVNNLTAA